ncbi:copper chaperone PCu(A)C [Pseudoxanthomonas sp. PXM02]|uniref:copper chaperone PCu(A)C n=1 Tax=Pseudoxanthomonas sp. PXM02 TaxID=2769294 RepID=UPI00177B12F1|nr:copper chaperone PCu(A)C [Pseudoxanthomonas sp. PXM02]MBD9479833.1 copper chaperone PCu(A)C [Pseudoxanthomonas sp. PXM02]
MNRRIETLCLSALLMSGACTASAAECVPVAKAAWVRLPPVAMPMMAGFARIENPCKVAVSIVGAESLAFDDVSLHETREENGVSRMREVNALPIAPGKAAELKPGGLHLMLHGPYQPLVAGEKPVITLKLADGRSLPVVFEVRKSAP